MGREAKTIIVVIERQQIRRPLQHLRWLYELESKHKLERKCLNKTNDTICISSRQVANRSDNPNKSFPAMGCWISLST